MKITKKKLELFFIVVTIILIAAFIGKSILNWRHKKVEEKNLLSWIKVTLIEIDDSAPPGLVIEVENTGPRIVGRIHFRLIFTFKEQTVCRVDTDKENFKLKEKRKILLKCSEQDYSSRYRGWQGKKISYMLQVFPEWKKPLELLRGEFILK